MAEETRSSVSSGSQTGSFSLQGESSEFASASVIFYSVQCSYSSNSDIECLYQLDKNITPHVNDYIGLFSVGSQGPTECIAKVPCALESLGGARSCKVVFRAKNLPRGNIRYYQFFYKTEDHITCGASTIFKLGRDVNTISTEDFVEVVYCTCDWDKAEYQNRINVLEQEKTELEKRVAHLESESVRNGRKLMNLSEENYALRKALEESKRLWFAIEGCNRLTLQGPENVKKIENELSSGIDELVSYNDQVMSHANRYNAVLKQMEEKWNVVGKKNADDLKGFTSLMPEKSAPISTSVSMKPVGVDNNTMSLDNNTAVGRSYDLREDCTSDESSSSAGLCHQQNVS